MPNYVTHRIVMTGPDDVLASIRDKHFGPIANDRGEATDFMWDFDTIIPMAQELKAIPRDGVSCIDEYLGELATMKPYPMPDYRAGVKLGRKDSMTPLAVMCGDFARSYPPAAGATSYADLLARLADAPPFCTQHQPRVEMRYTDLAEMIGRAIRACGYGDTLNFCTEQWGTKWGSFRCGFDKIEPGVTEFHFETAWSPPSPVLRRFAEMYPMVKLRGLAFDEGWNFEAAIVALDGVAATEKRKATAAGYEYVYGRPYEREDDEDAA